MRIEVEGKDLLFQDLGLLQLQGNSDLRARKALPSPNGHTIIVPRQEDIVLRGETDDNLLTLKQFNAFVRLYQSGNLSEADIIRANDDVEFARELLRKSTRKIYSWERLEKLADDIEAMCDENDRDLKRRRRAK